MYGAVLPMEGKSDAIQSPLDHSRRFKQYIRFPIGLFLLVAAFFALKRTTSDTIKMTLDQLSDEHGDDLVDGFYGDTLRGRLKDVHTAEAQADHVKKLPGLSEKIEFLQFAGYINIDTVKKGFYWFTEHVREPEKKPVVFWTNGGPGCSGLLGFMTEMGPFRPNADLSLRRNPHSWNEVANMLYVEQPVGVGFSYKTNSDDYEANDLSAAEENYQFLKNWYEKYPSYAEQDLYLTAESYGGHYIPTLAKYIVEKGDLPNFKGIMVGNPYTDPFENLLGAVDTLWGHQLIPEYLYEPWHKNCRTSSDDANNHTCIELENSIFMACGKVKPYALDYPVCDYNHQSVSKVLDHQKLALAKHQAKGSDLRLAQYAKLMTETLSKSTDNHYEACAGYDEVKYLNLPVVKKAIHANANITWSMCSYDLTYSYADSDNYMEPYWTWLAENRPDLSLLVYSGDDDDVCATRGTQYWIAEYFGAKKTYREWLPWRMNGQLAGYSMILQKGAGKLAFATVHGAGHEVPAYKPEAALKLFRNYINGSLETMTH